ncbi:hypothetical protein WM16_23395 [Burkholderia ubonensis]|uniref:Uncharacterized protein n=1 Tax=Burkholderia ubonensis TaxID=101571 RepID=A0A108C7I2_9BURK|nr:hypothetical protein WM16_23395 [Burkholderia ubonensis]
MARAHQVRVPAEPAGRRALARQPHQNKKGGHDVRARPVRNAPAVPARVPRQRRQSRVANAASDAATASASTAVQPNCASS